jgi:hypothetical protein
MADPEILRPSLFFPHILTASQALNLAKEASNLFNSIVQATTRNGFQPCFRGITYSAFARKETLSLRTSLYPD